MFSLGCFLSFLDWGEAVAAMDARKISAAMRKKLGWWWEGEMLCFPLFFGGVLGKVVCRTWFFCGENVVKCVVNVVGKRRVSGCQIVGHIIHIYF